MYKIAIIEEIHENGIKLLEDNPKYSYEIINDTSIENLKKKITRFRWVHSKS